MPQDLKLELDQLTHEEATSAAHMAPVVRGPTVGKWTWRQVESGAIS